jgi:hypothetical protein
VLCLWTAGSAGIVREPDAAAGDAAGAQRPAEGLEHDAGGAQRAATTRRVLPGHTPGQVSLSPLVLACLIVDTLLETEPGQLFCSCLYRMFT